MSFKMKMSTHKLVFAVDMAVKLSCDFKEDEIRLITVHLRFVIGKQFLKLQCYTSVTVGEKY